LFLNAYNITKKTVVEFQNADLDVHHFRAALSFPFLYAPYKIGENLYYEGAAFSCLNLVRVAVNKLGIQNTLPYTAPPDHNADKFILFDVLTNDVIHPARDLWDAYTQSIILPLVADAAKEQESFTVWRKSGNVEVGHDTYSLRASSRPLSTGNCLKPNVKEYRVSFDVPVEQWPYILDWSRSNMERLFDIGYEEGRMFLEEHGSDIWS
jgi:hypothetical protein